MAGIRRTDEQLIADAIDAVVAALQSADITVGNVGADGHFDAVLDVIVDDRPFTLAVEVKAYCTAPVARDLVTRLGGRERGAFPLVVAQRITADARAELTKAGWSWLDRRGRLHLRAPAVRVDADISLASTGEATPPGPPISGRSGISVAYWLLANPSRSLSPTGDAPELRLAPSTISTAVRRLAAAGVVDDERRALVPELFWELATVWRAERTWLATAPDPKRHLSSDSYAPKWRRSGTAAAALWGAPVVTGESGPIELYVPGPVEVSVAVRRYGAAEPGAGTAVLTVAPAAPVCAGEGSESSAIPDVGGWPAAPKLAVALDLAQDRARGREILEDWADADAVWR